MVLEQRT